MRTLTVTIEDDLAEGLEAASVRLGRDKSDLVSEALRPYVSECVPQQTSAEVAAGTRAIEDILGDLGRSIPREEWDRVPPDLSDQLDHYLYGAPRQ